jgi:hypothetical protein
LRSECRSEIKLHLDLIGLRRAAERCALQVKASGSASNGSQSCLGRESHVQDIPIDEVDGGLNIESVGGSHSIDLAVSRDSN